MSTQPDRRTLIGGLGSLGALAALGSPRLAWAGLDRLTLHGAPIGVSLPLAHLVDSGGLSAVVGRTGLDIWRSPDEMRAGVAAGQIALTTSPAPTAANLYNRGTGMRLAAVLTTGMLYLMTTDDRIARIEDLAGKPVLVPFRGDMPDRVFQLLLAHAGMSLDDVDVTYTATPIEAAQLLLAGRAPAAVLQEPAATAAIMRGIRGGVDVHRAVDFQAAYADATGGPPDIPMAVLILRDTLLAEAPELPVRLVEALRRSTAWVVNNPASAARLGEDYMGLRAPILERAIPYMNLSVRSPAEARRSLADFYERLAAGNADLLGGRLPDDGFYLNLGAAT